MDPPETLTPITPRRLCDVAAAAQAVQANVVTLRVAWCRRAGQRPENHDIKTPPPGPVGRRRDLLLDREVVKGYGLEEILLRLRQVWGEFCALCWLFPHVDPQHPIDFAHLSPGASLRCPSRIHAKLDEIQKHLWRIRHEQRRRHDPEARADPSFQREDEIARTVPVRIDNEDILVCTDEAVFCAACEYVGMLAALRWVTDDRWEWEGPGIMDIAVRAESLLRQKN